MAQLEYKLNENELFEVFRYITETRKDIIIIKWILQISVPLLMVASVIFFRIFKVFPILIVIFISLFWLMTIPKIWHTKLENRFKTQLKNKTLKASEIKLKFDKNLISITTNGEEISINRTELTQIFNLDGLTIFKYGSILLTVPKNLVDENIEKFVNK